MVRWVYPTTIAISIAAGSTVDEFEVFWQRNTSIGCYTEDVGNTIITDGSTTYNIMGLQKGSSYTVSATATNVAGISKVSNTVAVMTLEAGER